MMTLNKILANFTKTIKQLDSLIQANDNNIAGALEEEVRLAKRKAKAESEKAQALRVKEKIEGIIS